MSDGSLDAQVLSLLRSQTFEPDELPAVLAKQGHAKEDIDAAVQRALATLEGEFNSPARREARERAKTGKHLLRIGVLWLGVGCVASFLWGAGVLGYLLVLGIGSALIFAGNRSMKSSEIRRTDF